LSGEALHGCGLGLYLSLESGWAWLVSLNVIGGGRHWTSKNHATLSPGSVCYGLYVSRWFPQTAPTDDVVNITSELHDFCTLITTCTEKREDLTKSIGVVPAEYPSKVKLELFSQL